MRMVVIISCAVVLDLIFGDPHGWPHPIVFIGNFIAAMEKWMRKWFKNEFAGGFILVLVVAMVSFGLPFLLLWGLSQINETVRTVVEIYFCYQILAIKSLKKESMKVFTPLVAGDIPQARKFLSYIVGRDTASLTGEEITKATVETIAENTTDGVVAPLLFMALGGAPLAFMYKAINTMDSMIGYKNEKYLFFGRFAAKLDDVVNFIPARIAAMFMILASFILRMNTKNAIRIFIRDRKKHKSPNSAQTESVCAGALEIQLAGDATYFGKRVQKETIGDPIREIKAQDIVLANRLMLATSLMTAVFVCVVRGLLWQ